MTTRPAVPPRESLPDGAYQAPARPAEAELRERKSRFLAFLRPASSPEAAQEALDELRQRFPDASHHCWAWRLGAETRERCSDDGEPGGTAGPPILQALRGAGLSDSLAVVARWFGGIKLGKGGLVRAYGEAARLAVARAETVPVVPTETLTLELPYERIGAVKRLVHPPGVELVGEDYSDSVRITLQIHCHLRGEVEAALANLGLRAVEGGPGMSSQP